MMPQGTEKTQDDWAAVEASEMVVVNEAMVTWNSLTKHNGVKIQKGSCHGSSGSFRDAASERGYGPILIVMVEALEGLQSMVPVEASKSLTKEDLKGFPSSPQLTEEASGTLRPTPWSAPSVHDDELYESLMKTTEAAADRKATSDIQAVGMLCRQLEF